MTRGFFILFLLLTACSSSNKQEEKISIENLPRVQPDLSAIEEIKIEKLN
jgi:hypothetical protein